MSDQWGVLPDDTVLNVPEFIRAPFVRRAECEHGSLRRSCEICERDEEIARLRETVAGLRSALERLGAEHGLPDYAVKAMEMGK